MEYEVILELDDDHPVLHEQDSHLEVLDLARMAFNEWKGIRVVSADPRRRPEQVSPAPAPAPAAVVGSEAAAVVPTGAELRGRRLALGISVRGLAEAAGLDRLTVDRAEKDTPGTRATSLWALSRALDDLEGRAASSNAAADSSAEIQFEISNNAVTVTVRGPMSQAQALEESVATFMAQMR